MHAPKDVHAGLRIIVVMTAAFGFPEATLQARHLGPLSISYYARRWTGVGHKEIAHLRFNRSPKES